MKIARVLLLFAALGICAWLALRQSQSATPSGATGGATSGTGGAPTNAADVLREAEKLRGTAQEVPCRPGDPTCEPPPP